MAKPAYIICSRSKSEDRETNALSLFEIVERVALDASNPPESLEEQEPSAPQTQRGSSVFIACVLAVWLKEEDDYGASYEAEFGMVSPSGTDIPVPLPPFTMAKDAGSFLHRLMVRLDGLPPLTEGGVWMMEARIKRIGSSEWNKQRYPIVVDVTDTYLANIKHLQDNNPPPVVSLN